MDLGHGGKGCREKKGGVPDMCVHRSDSALPRPRVMEHLNRTLRPQTSALLHHASVLRTNYGTIAEREHSGSRCQAYKSYAWFAPQGVQINASSISMSSFIISDSVRPVRAWLS